MSSSPSTLDTLRRSGVVVTSDTAKYHQISKFALQDATTNPSLVYAAVTKPDGEYAHLIGEAVGYASRDSVPDLNAQAECACDYLVSTPRLLHRALFFTFSPTARPTRYPDPQNNPQAHVHLHRPMSRA
ncbi:hypothetical protein C0992_006928 [Termitomyces sp. T32_za158]|nr:hypothetical protein C0992_006928 [Termitomyces sp. T32_za158]